MKKIGFIAMSGVRAHNEELTRLGLTLPGFVDRNRIIASLPSLGLLTLAGLTPERFQVEYHEIADLKKLDILWQRGRESFASREGVLREYLKSSAEATNGNP